MTILLRLSTKIHVDKSLFIKEIIDNSQKSILITRPRRWGKSLNMSMLKYFLEIEIDKNGKIRKDKKRILAFEKLAIATVKYIDTREIVSRLLSLSSDQRIWKCQEIFKELVPETCEKYPSILQKILNEEDLTENEKNFLLEKADDYLQRLKSYFINFANLDEKLKNYINLSNDIKNNSEEDVEIKNQKKEDLFQLFEYLRLQIEIHINKNPELKTKLLKDGLDLYARHQGKYPVLFLSFKDITGKSYEEIESSFKGKISEI